MMYFEKTKIVPACAKISVFFYIFLVFLDQSWAWGLRGHHSICESAVFLVQNPELKKFLAFRPSTLGHLCNVPDIYWKSLPAEKTQLGNPSHYIDLEYLKNIPEETKTNFIELEKLLVGTKPLADRQSIKSVHMDVGSLWWRANQFVQLASNMKKDFENSPPPTNRKEEYNDDLPFNKNTLMFLTYIGVLGHFVGDNSQPMHVTVDYDGYADGHGGIHSFYEEEVVAEFDADLVQLITAKAREMKKNHDNKKKPLAFLNTKQSTAKHLGHSNSLQDPILQMKALSEISFSEISALYKADRVLQKSILKDDKGMQIKTPAQRRAAKQEFSQFRPLIINQMARSALLLAHFWDMSFQNAGSPLLSKYKAYRYPFTPEFIPPDYLTEPKTSEKSGSGQ